MRLTIVACLLATLFLVGLGGCRTAPGALLGSGVEPGVTALKPIARPDARTEMVPVNDVLPGAPPTPPPVAAPPASLPAPCEAPPARRSYMRQGWAPPCGPRCWSGCGLPCEEGFPNWHARAVGGFAFMAGDDAGGECAYFGADLGWTSCCCCLGVDLFYRTHEAEFDRTFLFPNAAPLGGTDGGRFHHLGAKLTWEGSICRSRFFGYAGIGPQYFWTQNYINNDSGIGGFGEIGVGYAFNQCWRVRAGLEILAQDTDVTRNNPANDGQSRLLWVFAPVLQVEVDF